MNRKIIFFDVDGTLFDNDTISIPKSCITALKELAKDDNYLLALATGRTYKTINVIDEIKDLFRLKVLINGQVIMYDKKIIYNNPINVKRLIKLRDYLFEKRMPQGFVGIQNEAITIENEYVRECFSRFLIDLPEIDKDFIFKEEIYQSWIWANKEELDELEIMFPEFAFFRWHGNGADVISSENSKAKGILKALKYLNIDIKDTIAIGDGDNDYEMIKLAGLGIAMGNSCDKIKRIADYVAPKINEDGIAKAIEYIHSFVINNS